MSKVRNKTSDPAPTAPPPATAPDVRALLRDVGLKWTAARAAVVDVMRAAGGPLSHAEVFEKIEDQGFDRATAYRNLVDLSTSGVLKRRDVGDHIWRFELVQSKHNADAHPHFMCNSCGDVSCLPEAAVSLGRAAKSLGKVSEIVVKGDCARCVED